MATWRAQCWLGSSGGYQDLEVQASTFQGAVQQFKRVYGAEQVCNVRELSNRRSSSGGGSISTSFSELLWFCLFLLAIAFWYIVIPVALIIGIIKLIIWFKSL
jgi:hypothetical protein